jgi:hypothetical protein
MDTRRRRGLCWNWKETLKAGGALLIIPKIKGANVKELATARVNRIDTHESRLNLMPRCDQESGCTCTKHGGG